MLAAVLALEVAPSLVAASMVEPLSVGASFTLETLAPRLRLVVFQAPVAVTPPTLVMSRVAEAVALTLALMSTELSATRTLKAPGVPK